MDYRLFIRVAYAVFMLNIASCGASLRGTIFTQSDVTVSAYIKVIPKEEAEVDSVTARVKAAFLEGVYNKMSDYHLLIELFDKNKIGPTFQDSKTGASMAHIIINLFGSKESGNLISDKVTQDFLKQLVCKGFNFSLVHLKTGNSAFHLAAAAKNPLLVTMLLACHPMPVDLFMKNKEGETIIDALKAGQKIYPLMHINRQCFLQTPSCSAVGAFTTLNGAKNYAYYVSTDTCIKNLAEYKKRCEATECFFKKYQQNFATQAALHCMKQQRRYTDLVIMHK